MEILISLIIMLITVSAGFLYTQKQINTMKNIEREKRIVAIQSLILELEYNQQLVNSYIKNCKEGGHLDLSGKSYTWELITPYFENYQYLALACYANINLAKNITEIYSKLETCKVIVNQINFFWANNIIIKETVINGKQLLQSEIVKYNSYLLNVSNDVMNLFNKAIKGLESIRYSLNVKETT